MTFNIKTLQLSPLFNLKKECENDTHVFYCYSNIHKDIIIFVAEHDAEYYLYIIKESKENCLYISKETWLPEPEGYTFHNISCCNNRNNEIILFITVIAEHGFCDRIYYYDVLNGNRCKPFYNCNASDDVYNSKVFFNPTGEEIFVEEENQLDVYVYKSKIRSLKRTCQILVLEQYSSEQLNLMNLPKYLLRSD